MSDSGTTKPEKGNGPASASLVVSILAALAGSGLLAWLFSLEGTGGAYRWGFREPFLAVLALALLPLPLAVAAVLRARKEAREGTPPRRALAFAALGMAILGAAVSVGIGSFVALKAFAPVERAGDLVLLDPSAPPSPRAASGPRLAISSDPHFDRAESARDETRRLLRTVAAGPYDAFFCLGDHVELGMEASGWPVAVAEFSRALGALPLRPLLGNHDAVIAGEFHWRQVFFPHALPESGSPYYWTVEWPELKIVAMNVTWDAKSVGARQLEWLDRVLASYPRDAPVVVLMHAFVLSSGYVDEGSGMPWYDDEELVALLHPIFVRHGVDLVVSGHNHYMELLERDGVTYAVIGAMGGIPDPDPEYVSPWSRWFRRGMYGFIDLAIVAEGLAVTFRAANGDELKSLVVENR